MDDKKHLQPRLQVLLSSRCTATYTVSNGGVRMKIVLMKSPKALAPLLRKLFGVPKNRG